jgi:hypothetical protein
MINVRDRSDPNPNTGVITGQPRLREGYAPPAAAGNEDCESGPPSVIAKAAQGPVTARPDAAPVGVKAALNSRSQLAQGPAIANPNTSSATITSR